MELAGLKIHLFDTAGMRKSEDIIEKAGIARSYSTAQESDMILCVTDSSQEDDFLWLKEQKELMHKKGMFLFNKCDVKIAPQKELPFPWPREDISVKTGTGLPNIINFIEAYAKESSASSKLAITSIRHLEALKAAKEALNSALENMPPDILSIDLTEAWIQLGTITGQNVTEDIVNNIFEKFCVGK